jgi:hypothetical protein
MFAAGSEICLAPCEEASRYRVQRCRGRSATDTAGTRKSDHSGFNCGANTVEVTSHCEPRGQSTLSASCATVALESGLVPSGVVTSAVASASGLPVAAIIDASGTTDDEPARSTSSGEAEVASGAEGFHEDSASTQYEVDTARGCTDTQRGSAGARCTSLPPA